jgi:glucosamine--fructose-6-phosphate aminotransferase (isomerizing)
MPSILLCTKDELYKDAWSALEQVCARHGNVIAICNEGDEDVRGKAQRVIEVPHICDALAGIVNVLPLQLLSYHLAVMLGRNVDQPRNLAKSVVV